MKSPAPELDAFFGGTTPDDYGPPRDRYKRPMLVPTAEYPGIPAEIRVAADQARRQIENGERIAANHTGRVPYTRASSMSGYIADFQALHTWRERRIAKGIAMRPDLAAMAAALPAFKNNSQDDRLTNSRLSEIIELAAELGQIHEQANWGTAVHSWTDPGADLATVHAEYRPDVEAYWAEVKRLGIVQLEAEIFTANDRLKGAGTVDGTYYVPGYGKVMGDKKTGDRKPLEFAIQFATYRFGERYDWETDRREPWDDDLNADVALVFDIPAGKGKLEIHEIDLRWGLECAQIAADVRDRHTDSKNRLRKRVNDEIATALANERHAAFVAIEAATSREELNVIWKQHEHVWTEDHTVAGHASIADMPQGCCTTCGGTGTSGDVETNGQCWDCRGTGHTHDGPCA